MSTEPPWATSCIGPTADQLYITIRTVRPHLDRIRHKTSCHRRAGTRFAWLRRGPESRELLRTTPGTPTDTAPRERP